MMANPNGMSFAFAALLLATAHHRATSFSITSNVNRSLRTILESSVVPDENQTIDPNKASLSGTTYGDVLSGLNMLYPPDEMSSRNAMSRTDGYWKYISKGEEPPSTLVYGEFDFLTFSDLLDKSVAYYNESIENQDGKLVNGWSDKTFLDIGSGTGRLVIGAAALHPFKVCKGLEILPGIHESALNNLEICKRSSRSSDGSATDKNPQKINTSHLPYEWNPMTGGAASLEDGQNQSNELSSSEYSLSTDDGKVLPLSPIAFTCGSFDDPYEYIGDSDIVFVFSTCFSEEMMSKLSDCIGRQCRQGTIVITTEYKLNSAGTIQPLPGTTMSFGDYDIDLVDSIDCYNWLVGGKSTAHVHRVMNSLWDGNGPPTRPYTPNETDDSDGLVAFLKG